MSRLLVEDKSRPIVTSFGRTSQLERKHSGRKIPFNVSLTKTLSPVFEQALKNWSRVLVGPNMDSLSPMSIDFLKKHQNESLLFCGSVEGQPAFLGRVTFRKERFGPDILQEETSVEDQVPIRLPIDWGFLNMNRVNPLMWRGGLGTLNIALRCLYIMSLGYTHVSTLIVPRPVWWRKVWNKTLGFTIERDNLRCRFDGNNVCSAIYIKRALDNDFRLLLNGIIADTRRQFELIGLDLRLSEALKGALLLADNNIRIGDGRIRLYV